MKQHRRHFLKSASYATALAVFAPAINSLAASKVKKTKILLHSAWQTVNIGDIGHTFGILELFKKYLPESEITLWPRNALDRNVDKLLKASFPALILIDTPSTAAGSRPAAVQKAFDECDLMIHSSGPHLVGAPGLLAWHRETKKPFGVYGVSLDELKGELREVVDYAAFFYCRDTESLKYLKTLNLKSPIQAFAPDATFAINLHNEPAASAYMQKTGLKKGEFICLIPRLRYTPYFQIKGTEPTAEDSRKHAISLAFKEVDAQKMREIISRWVTETGMKVLVCPEMTYEVPLGKEVVDPLPPEIRKNVVWRDSFWLPDEAASVYAKARAMVCFEPHSLIMAVAEGIPCIHMKQPTDTRKGQMWRDIGLGDWYFLIDETPGSQIADALMKIHHNYPEALRITERARRNVIEVQDDNFKEIRKVINGI